MHATSDDVEAYEAAVEQLYEELEEAPDGVSGELEALQSFFERIAEQDPSPMVREGAIADAVEASDFLTKKAARRELAQIRGVDRDT